MNQTQGQANEGLCLSSSACRLSNPPVHLVEVLTPLSGMPKYWSSRESWEPAIRWPEREKKVQVREGMGKV